MSKEENFYDKFKTPIPPHLTPEERERWEEEYEWELQEKARREKEGLYDERPKKKRIGWKFIQNLFRKEKKW
tara:strand:+ start:3343 stop:3558 length:216 start_codon:yes stop_codon:yes gene_type:complete